MARTSPGCLADAWADWLPVRLRMVDVLHVNLYSLVLILIVGAVVVTGYGAAVSRQVEESTGHLHKLNDLDPVMIKPRWRSSSTSVTRSRTADPPGVQKVHAVVLKASGVTDEA